MKISLGLVVLWAVVTPVNAAPQSIPIEQQIMEVVSHLVGTMDTSAQAATNPNISDVRMITCRVNIDQTNAEVNPELSVFLYQEQALSDRLNQPYRQRFLQITASTEENGVESIAFEPSNPQAWIGLCDRQENQRVVKQGELGEVVCQVSIQPHGQTYIGTTPVEGCPTDYRGALRVTNTIILHQEGMDTLDQGFDVEGNLVWGATDVPYQFRWSDN